MTDKISTTSSKGIIFVTMTITNHLNFIADLVWYGESYSAFAVVQATIFNLTVAFIDVNSNVKYLYTIDREFYPEMLDPDDDYNNR